MQMIALKSHLYKTRIKMNRIQLFLYIEKKRVDLTGNWISINAI